MAKVFKIRDDEWEEIVGVEQLEEHAKIQMQAFLDELGLNVADAETKDGEQILTEEVEYRLRSLDRLQEVKDIIKKFDETDELYTVDESKLALELRYFEIEELDIH